MSGIFNPAEFVRVTNNDESATEKGKKFIRGRFDGKDYIFPLGKPVDVPIVAATHIFGFGLDDKSAAFSRLGWARRSDELDEAYERLKKIKFEDLPTMMEVPRKAIASGRPLGKSNGPEGADESAPDGPKASKEAM